MAERPAEQAPPLEDERPDHVQIIEGPQARKLARLSQRLAARRGTSLGLMATVRDVLKVAHVVYRQAAEEVAAVTPQEVSLLLAFVKRLDRRCHELAVVQAGGMVEMSKILEQCSRELEEADRGGYGIRKLQEQADRDRRALDRLRASIKARVDETASVLAELEQEVDPVPGFRIVSASQRARNAKSRKGAKQAMKLPPGVTEQDIAPGRPTRQDRSVLQDMSPKTSAFSG